MKYEKKTTTAQNEDIDIEIVDIEPHFDGTRNPADMDEMHESGNRKPQQKPGRKKKKLSKGAKASIIIGAVILALAAAAAIAFLIITSGIKHVDMNRYSDEELGITTAAAEEDEDPTAASKKSDTETEVTPADNINVVFFGLSGPNRGIDEDRSDSIIICTLAPHAKEIRFTSILRDTKAQIEGYAPQKINAAYKYGGATLALKTLNQNFGLRLRNYVTVNFEEMEAIVDYVGGVDIEATEAEAGKIPNGYAGLMHMDGKQAVTYSRIRYIDSDVVRSDRQKNVLSCLFDKFKVLPVTSKIQFAKEFMDLVETSLTLGDIIDLARAPINDYTVVRTTVPDQNVDLDVWGGIDDTGSWVWTYDMEYAASRIQPLLYE